jgi:hypothetical protein
MYLLWCLWKKRNDISFKGHEKTLEEMDFFLENFVSLDNCLCFFFNY